MYFRAVFLLSFYFLSGFSHYLRTLCLNLDSRRLLPTLLRHVLPLLPPPAAALVSAASAQGTSSSSFANNDKSLQSAISETCRADLSGESNVVGATPNSHALFRQFLDFLNSDSNSRSEFSAPSPAPAPRVLASAPPPIAFTVNPPTATLGCPAVGPAFRDSRPIQSLELADIPATLPYAGVHKSRGAREGRSQPPPHWSAPGGGFGFGALWWHFY